MDDLKKNRHRSPIYSLPNITQEELKGWFFALDGIHGCGCTSVVESLQSALEKEGYAVEEFHLNDSSLVAPELKNALDGNLIHRRALYLLQATDFYDQMEKIIVPALHAGKVVLADRYFYSLLVLMGIEGLGEDWLQSIFDAALIPDTVFYLSVPPEIAAHRLLRERQSIDYWDTGMSKNVGSDMYTDFIKFQTRLQNQWTRIIAESHFIEVPSSEPIEDVTKKIYSEILKQIKS